MTHTSCNQGLLQPRFSRLRREPHLLPSRGLPIGNTGLSVPGSGTFTRISARIEIELSQTINNSILMWYIVLGTKISPCGTQTIEIPYLKMCMAINDLVDEILEQSTHEGCFTLSELLHYSNIHSLTGMGISKDSTHTFFLVFSRGEPDGAVFADEKGTLFGDSAVLHLADGEEFDLYLVAPPIADALVSRCRVFEKSHLKRNGRLDIPTIGAPTRQRVGVLCLTVYDGQTPLAGAHVSVRKGKLVITSDVTDSGGRVCFRLLNGRYMCVVSDRTGERTRCIVEFHEPQVETRVDIGGTEDESR